MKDLYRRGKLKDYEADRNRILDCTGLPEDVEAACLILLDKQRKEEYDHCHAVLRTVARARRNLSVPTTHSWQDKYRDFYDHVDTAEPLADANGVSDAKKSRPVKWLGAAVASLFLVCAVALLNMGNPDAENDGTTADYQGAVLSKEVYSSSAPVRQQPEDGALIVTKLSRYDMVDVLVDKSTDEWDFVLLDEVEGFIFNEHLSIGNNEAEELRRCAELGVERLGNGTVISSLQYGRHQLTVVNPFAQDVVVKLKNRAGVDIVTLYLWGHQTFVFDGIPEGLFDLFFAKGKNYSPSCGRFLEQMQAMGDRRPLEFRPAEWNTGSAQPIELTYIVENNSNRNYPVPARLF